MAEIINLFVDFKSHELYPKNREFSDYEAWLDLLINCYPEGKVTASLAQMGVAWKWNKSRVNRFLDYLESIKLLVRTTEGWQINKADRWYKLPEHVKEIPLANAQRVLDEFNRIMGGGKRKLNDYRARTITARIKEGLKSDPPISIADFRTVFEFKKAEWSDDPEMAKHLVIETLCARKHFMKYLEQARMSKKTENNSKMTGSILNAR